jgi:protein-disulfide isomerase/uncharacterized membrane protein
VSRDGARRLAVVGALLGLFASLYLLVDYVFGSGICLTGSGCDVVRASPFAYPLGIPTPLLGAGFYAFAGAIVLASPDRRVAGFRLPLVAVALAALGVAVMAFLTFIEIVVIGALCSWCLLSALASVVLLAGAVPAWRSDAPEGPREARSSRERRRVTAAVDRARGELRRFALRTGALLGIALVVLIAVPPLVAGRPSDRIDLGAADRPRLGDGSVEVMVFSDFQCPACAVAAPVLRQLADEGEISLVYRYFPLASIHANATAAARSAEAAARQGAFWEFHDALFAAQPGWAHLGAVDAEAAFASVASDLGLDVERWRADAASSSVADVVDADVREATRLQLTGTPTIFIAGDRYGGPLNRDGILAAVRDAASAASATP